MSQTDSSLSERLRRALERDPHLSRRKLRLEIQDGSVTMRGTVGSYYQKQMAQEMLRRIDGVEQIANELEVHWAEPHRLTRAEKLAKELEA